MVDKGISPSHSRIGWLYDGDSQTPDIAVMLQNTGDQIVLSVPYKSMTDAPYGRWFGAGGHFGDDPSRTTYSYRPPDQLMFHDPEGTVVLVGCRSAGSNEQLGGAGVGRIVPNYAVVGARHLRYAKVNGLRSEIPGLAQWAGITSLSKSFNRGADGLVQRLDVTLDSPAPMKLSRSMNLSLHPTWATESEDQSGSFISRDIVQLQTMTKRPRSWNDHLALHIAVQELLLVSAWYPFGFSRLLARRSDDPERALSGRRAHERWADVVTYLLPRHQEWERQPHYLFTFGDVGVAGVGRWLRLRRRFARALQPLVAIASEPNLSLQSRALQSGVALEALGHQISVEDGRIRDDQQINYTRALNKLLGDLDFVPLDDPNDWKERARDSYRGVKHPDNPLPDTLELANTVRENLLLLRVWIAQKLGASGEVIENRLKLDGMTKPYVWLDED